MLLFIEGYKYNLDSPIISRGEMKIRDVLGDIFTIPKLEKDMDFKYVGYCYSHVAEDVVFFLPKVVLTDGSDTVFGTKPTELIDFEAFAGNFEDGNEDVENYKEFLSTLAIWIYRVLSVYNEKENDNILENKETQTQSEGKKIKHNTLFDVIIALLDFNRENQDYLTLIARNTHSGNNNIQWTKTISKTTAMIQNDSPIYLNTVNRKKMVNFDEELLVIFYSILNYINEEHGFRYLKNLNYEVVKPNIIKNRYIKAGYGKRRLKEIKYKYFSDKALRIWDLCYAFFVRSHEIAINKSRQDCLMAKDFDIVFEKMIDELIGERNLPKELTEQKDGKIVDHLFLDRGLIESADGVAPNTYYIGDSKYYKRNESDEVALGINSIYKQYTYAKNIVQWNVDLFLGLKNEEGEKLKNDGHHQLRDELTEGYNPIPNFFISAHIRDAKDGSHKLLAFDDDKITQQNSLNLNRQFENRLFDRDTMLLSHYDVNFLFIVALYGRNKDSAKDAWRNKVRQQFRTEIQTLLNEMYSFHVLQPRAGKDCYAFVKNNFSVLNGKVYRPYPDANYLILAELKDEPSETRVKDLWEKAKVTMGSDEETLSYEETLKEMGSYFDITKDVEISAEGGFQFQHLPKQGSLKKTDSEERNILACHISKEKPGYKDAVDGVLQEFVLTGTHSYGFSDLKFFVPFTDKGIQGYYKIDNVIPFIGKKDNQSELRLRLKLSNYHMWGEWKKTDTGLRHPDLFSMTEISNIYDSGILIMPTKRRP